MSRKILIFILILFSISTVYSVSYISPTPEDNSKIAKWNITFRVYDEGVNINDCTLELGDTNYSMTYSGGYCTRTIADFEPAVQEFQFRVFYDSNSNVLATRTFTYFPTAEQFAEAPFMSFYSFITLILILLGSLYFRR